MDSLLQSMASAKSFLVSQLRDNHWSDYYSSRFGTSTDWVTGYAGFSLEDKFPAEQLSSVAQWLLGRQKSNLWGWGYDFVPFPSDADSTSMCALFLNAHGYLSANNKKQIIQALFKHRRSNGGFSTFENPQIFAPINPAPDDISFSGWCLAHGSVTASVLQCLVALGVSPYDPRLAPAFGYLESLQAGLWGDYWWRDPFYPTYEALAALALRDPHPHPQVSKAIVGLQHSAGYWDCDGVECAFSSGMAIKALLLSGNAEAAIWHGVNRLIETQLSDGSWSGQLILQIPAPTDVRANRDLISNIHEDVNRIFSTATVYSALLEANRSIERTQAFATAA